MREKIKYTALIILICMSCTGLTAELGGFMGVEYLYIDDISVAKREITIRGEKVKFISDDNASLTDAFGDSSARKLDLKKVKPNEQYYILFYYDDKSSNFVGIYNENPME